MLNIVIPAAGKGQRFADEGYQLPKPLIDVCGKPMIQRVVENLKPVNIESEVFLITRAEHKILNSEVLSSWGVVGGKQLGHDTEGAACTVLELLEADNGYPDGEVKFAPDLSQPLVIANCDQLLLGFSMDDFIQKMQGLDAGVITFNSTNPHHSYVRTDRNGIVTDVAEKIVISDQAVAGIYYYATGADFIKYARQMIEKNIRTNNEFYISPVYAEYIADGKRIGTYEVDVNSKHMLGTPAELRIFLDKERDGRVSL